MIKSYLYHLIVDDGVDVVSRVVKGFLRGLSYIYLLASRCAFWCYHAGILKQHCLAKPVISVGNLTLGGTGKTPLVAFLARMLQRQGHHPAILMRGYMTVRHSSDEASLYMDMMPDVPVQQGRDRLLSSQQILQQSPQVDTFLLDDGFQHWRLKRDLDIVTVDVTDAFSNGFLLPRGFLREPIAALKRADVIVLTKTDLAPEQLPRIYQQVKKNNFHAVFVETVYQPTRLIDVRGIQQDKETEYIAHKDVCLFSAIGNPRAFKKTVYDLKANIQKTFSFLDHHVYTPADIERMMMHDRPKKTKIYITTQKDAVKLQELSYVMPTDIELFALAVELKIVKGEEELEQRIHSVLFR